MASFSRDRESLETALSRFSPWNEQEQKDRERILHFLQQVPDAFKRNNETAHFTASGWILNQNGDRVLMVYHNRYDSWSWCGGHADGETDLLQVALREAKEETGVCHIAPVSPQIFSVEILPVFGHEKRGRYVPSHLHMNVTYLLRADERDVLHPCEGENSGVRWFTPQEALTASTEKWMTERIYRKLVEKELARRKGKRTE